MAITVTSSAFADGEPIPRRHTGDGEDLSPPLAFDGVPDEVAALALICDDPDAPREDPWVHWVLYGLSGAVRALPEGLARSERLREPAGAEQGLNSWGQVGWRGPAPPRGHGRHRYFFTLYALTGVPELRPGLGKEDLLRAIEPHVVATAQLMGTYERA